MSENIILNLGGGGASLNFKVVGNPQPENPRENTIWLNTDVPIGAWYFSATQPENLVDGDVWFPVGTSSPAEFNALKKNSLQVYPQSAKQYVGGTLVDVTAKIRRNGNWVDWVNYLFNNGDPCAAVTGGWVAYNAAGSTATIGDTLSIAVTGESARVASAITANKIDFKAGEELEFTVNVPSLGDGAVHVGITLEPKAYAVFVAETLAQASGDHVLTVPITESASYYVAFRVDKTNAACSMVIKK